MFGKSDDSAGDDWAAQFSQATSMSYTTRMYGFIGCFLLGALITFASIFAIGDIKTNPSKFAVLYSLGNIVVLCSTCFLWGCLDQIKGMFDPVRVVATVVYLISICLTVYLAATSAGVAAIIVCMIVQFLAGLYYALTYIPYGREMLKGCLGNMCGL